MEAPSRPGSRGGSPAPSRGRRRGRQPRRAHTRVGGPLPDARRIRDRQRREQERLHPSAPAAPFRAPSEWSRPPFARAASPSRSGSCCRIDSSSTRGDSSTRLRGLRQPGVHSARSSRSGRAPRSPRRSSSTAPRPLRRQEPRHRPAVRRGRRSRALPARGVPAHRPPSPLQGPDPAAGPVLARTRVRGHPPVPPTLRPGHRRPANTPRGPGPPGPPWMRSRALPPLAPVTHRREIRWRPAAAGGRILPPPPPAGLPAPGR